MTIRPARDRRKARPSQRRLEAQFPTARHGHGCHGCHGSPTSCCDTCQMMLNDVKLMSYVSCVSIQGLVPNFWDAERQSCDLVLHRKVDMLEHVGTTCHTFQLKLIEVSQVSLLVRSVRSFFIKHPPPHPPPPSPNQSPSPHLQTPRRLKRRDPRR